MDPGPRLLHPFPTRRSSDLTESPFLVATWGLRPARVLLPPGSGEWSDDRIRAVLYHELAHVARAEDRKSTRLNSSHSSISYAVFCLKKKRICVASMPMAHMR